MVFNTSAVASQLSSIYNENNKLLAETLTRISSGKKVEKPSDDYIAYIRAKGIQDDIDGYNTVTQDLTEAKQVTDTAVSLGNNIYDDLLRMKELADLYAASSSDTDKASYDVEFKAIASSIASQISSNEYNGKKVMSVNTLLSVKIDPNKSSLTIDVSYAAGDITDIAANSSDWTLATVGQTSGKTSANVQTEIDKALSFIDKSYAYQTRIDRQMDITDTIVENKTSLKSLLTDINDVEELNTATTLQIRQQASIAMMAQANMINASMAQLYSSMGLR